MKHFFTSIAVWFLPGAIAAQFTISVTTTPASCFGASDGTATVTISGGQPPYQISWNPGSCTTATCTNLCSGFYTVVVFDSGGNSAVGDGTVTEPAMLNLTVTISQQPSCPTCCDGTGQATASGGTPAYNYNWTPSGPANLCNAVYEVCVVDANGCTTCDSVYVGTTSIPNHNVPLSLSIMPNPATDVINIGCPSFNSGFDLVILDVTGKDVIRQVGIGDYNPELSLNISELPAGMYFIYLMSEERWASGRFVK